MIKNLLNVLRKTSMISWNTNNDVPTMFNIKIQDNNNVILIIADLLIQEATGQMDIIHNYKIKIEKGELIKFNKSLDGVLTLFYKDCSKNLILSY
ncbi:hypothetical protein [Clostridium rectalis]|uniref:hypothetical protein n=1 Tax=Clostridium rectalis TaxID=2040295 RepID=UPI000F63587B|nr:hypothetical protein [Clostridium rectalis]